MLRIMRNLTKQALAVAVSAGVLAGCSSVTSSPASSTSQTTKTSASTTADTTTAAFAELATKFHAQFGLYAIDTGTGRSVAYQADERFAFCSVIKAFAASVLLQRDTDRQLAQVITYGKSDLVDYSPVTSQHVGTGMTLTAVMAAALEVSDNTALNLMLNQIGGPSALQTALRGLGDTTTNVDRTTRRAQLVSWLQANTTGGPYIRAAVPAGWKVGDKTGNGDYGTRNDIAALWPPSGAPIVIAVLSNRGDDENATSNDALIADATKLALQAVA